MAPAAAGSEPGPGPGPGPVQLEPQALEEEREKEVAVAEVRGEVMAREQEQEQVVAVVVADAAKEEVPIVISQPEEDGVGVAPASPAAVVDGGAKAVAAAKEAEVAGAVTIVIAQPEEGKGVAAPGSPAAAVEGGARAVAAAKEAELARSDSFDEQCRVCQQKTEEPLVDLGCRCRGDLSKAHRTCIGVWFRTRGSNKCEICQQIAVNIPPPETQASTSYWVWRVDSAYGRGRGGRERGWFSPLWVAFAILIGGLLLDVLISVSLGVSALPVNIIIGVLIVLGLGTALRLALECCQEWGSRRSMPRLPLDGMAPSGYHPGV